jgi:predicted DNA-binding transcriptional regulator AlpA
VKPIPSNPDTGLQIPPEDTGAAVSAAVANDVMVSQNDAIAITGVSIRTLQRLTDAGDGPPRIRLGRRILYPKSALLAWALRHAE